MSVPYLEWVDICWHPPRNSLHNVAFTHHLCKFQVVLLRGAHKERERCSDIQIHTVHGKTSLHLAPEFQPHSSVDSHVTPL